MLSEVEVSVLDFSHSFRMTEHNRRPFGNEGLFCFIFVLMRCFLIIFLLLLSISVYGQEKIYCPSEDSVRRDTYKAAIKKLLAFKQQYPDSFIIKREGINLISFYYLIDDTVNFINSSLEFLNTINDKNDLKEYYNRGVCQKLYDVYKAKRDTQNAIMYAEKRLFIFNRVKCATGEKNLRLKLFDELINYYSTIGKINPLPPHKV